MQIIGPVTTAVMQEHSLRFSLPTDGQGEVNLVVNPSLLTLRWGCETEINLGDDGFIAFLLKKSGRVLANVGRMRRTAPSDLDVPLADGRMRALLLAGDGEVLVVAEVSRDLGLRNWHNELYFGAPLVGLIGALLMALVARSAWMISARPIPASAACTSSTSTCSRSTAIPSTPSAEARHGWASSTATSISSRRRPTREIPKDASPAFFGSRSKRCDLRFAPCLNCECR